MCLKKDLENKTKEELGQLIITEANELIEILDKEKLKQKLIEYELVRQQGRYNMVDDKARQLVGLSKEDYIYIIKHYDELMKKYPDTKRQVQQRLDYIKSAEIAKLTAIKGCNNCIEIVCKKLDVNIDDLCERCKKEIEPYIDSRSKIYNI